MIDPTIYTKQGASFYSWASGDRFQGTLLNGMSEKKDLCFSEVGDYILVSFNKNIVTFKDKKDEIVTVPFHNFSFPVCFSVSTWYQGATLEVKFS